MFIRSLSLNQFRNLAFTEMNFSDKLNIFIGENGHGKTNILEAIYLLIEKESFRYSKNSTMIQLQKDQTVLNSFIHNNNLEFHFKLNMSESRKEIFVNNKKFLNTDQFRAILFSPESLSVIKESAEQRRDLVDQLVCSSSNLNARLVKDYKKALRTRNKILKDYQNQKLPLDLAKDTLLSINPIFLELAQKLTLARLKVLTGTKALVQNYLNQLNQNTDEIRRPVYGFSYLFSENSFFDYDELKTSIKIKQILEKRAEELMLAELSAGTSLIGPQKHDIAFLYNGNDSRFFCSQGQQRTIILAFKMAQIVYHHKVHGFYPVLLLDDVLSELDQNRQEALISALSEINTQTFLTTTDLDSLKKLNTKFILENAQQKIFIVRDGIVTESQKERSVTMSLNETVATPLNEIVESKNDKYDDGIIN
jgi:DNA replication and repair protein RecF